MSEIRISTTKLEPTVKELKRVLAYETPDVITSIVATAMLLIELEKLIEDPRPNQTLEMFVQVFSSLREDSAQ